MKYIKFLMLVAGLFALGAHAADPPAAATYRVLDDKLLVFGTDNDFQFKYDSGDNRLEIQDAAGNLLIRASDAGTTGVVGVKQIDVINGSYASQITSGATANRAVTLPDAPGELSLLGQTISSSEITDGEIVNADINASAAIAATKLNAGTDGQVVVTSSSAAGWGTVPSAGITNGTILNEDINASAAIAVTKLSTSGASTDYVLTYNGSAIVWAPAAGTGDIEAGANLGTDNLIPRMDGTGSDTLQGYTSNGITASDAGLLTVPGGINSTGTIELENGNVLLSDTSYLKYARDNEVRWDISYSTGSETGTSGETSLKFTAYDNDGNSLREVMKLNRTASEGVVFGSNTAPSPVYVKGDVYAHTDDRLIIDDGYVRLDALAQTSATLGQSIVWDGTKWAPSSVSVNWGSPGAIGSSTPNSGVFTTLTASSGTFSEALITDDNRLSWGTDLDIQAKYDEATDNRLEFSDGTNLLAYLTDAGTEGNWGVTGDTFVQDDDFLVFGTDSDIKVTYDETTDDRLEWSDGTNNLAYLTDLGATGALGVSGRIETPQIGVSADNDLFVLSSGAITAKNSTFDLYREISATSSQAAYRTYLNNTSNAQTEAARWHTVWTANTLGAESSRTVLQAKQAGSMVDIVTLTGATLTTALAGPVTIAGATTIGDAVADTLHINANTITFEGGTLDANDITMVMPSGAYTYTWPGKTGTVAMTSDISNVQLYTNSTRVGNAGAGEDDLMTYTVPAGKLAATNDRLEIYGTFDLDTGGANTLKFYWNGVAVYDSGSVTPTDANVDMHVTVIRTSAAGQNIIIRLNTASTTHVTRVAQTTGTATMSGTVALKWTGQDAGSTDDDIAQTWGAVEYKPAA